MADGGAPGLHAALLRNTGYLISRLGVHASRRFSDRLTGIGLTTRMWGALNVLEDDGPLTQQLLAHAIGMDPSTMVAAIDTLEARGLVERRRHPHDRRAYALHVTPEGRDTLQQGRRLAREAQEELLAPLSAAERRELHRLLLELALAAGKVPEVRDH